MNLDLHRLLEFTKFTHKFQKITRTINVVGENRKENDLEHSGQLALLAFYIIDSNDLNLNSGLAVKYALVHDFVEVYAGDVFLYTKDQKAKELKKSREHDALEKLSQTYAEFAALHELIRNYEESKFIYALDKIITLLNNYLDNGKSWKEEGITLEMVIKNKSEKVAVSPEVKVYFDQLVEILKENEMQLFPPK